MDVDIIRRGNVVIFNLNGHLVTENLITVEDVWRDEIARRPEIIALNCKKLFAIDSPAIGTLVMFLNHAMNNNINLVFCDVNAGIRKLFRAARLNTFFTMTTGARFEERYLAEKAGR
jgi:anti-anti-sigma factor